MLFANIHTVSVIKVLDHLVSFSLYQVFFLCWGYEHFCFYCVLLHQGQMILISREITIQFLDHLLKLALVIKLLIRAVP